MLATFSVESYKLLQPDPSQTSAYLLAQISQQLNSFQINPSFANSSHQAAPLDPSPTRLQPTVVFINIFWFLSLVFSLATASLAMMVKQWLRAYLANDNTSPQAQVRVRYFRHCALQRWNVFEIAGFLPSLLQFALALFFVALCLFLHQIHFALFVAVSCTVGVYFACYAFILAGPIFSSSCPYKSPSLNGLIVFLRHTLYRFLDASMRIEVVARLIPEKLAPTPLVEESKIGTVSHQDDKLWTEAESIFFDDHFVKNTIHVCLKDVNGPAALDCVQGVFERREKALRTEPQNLAENAQNSLSLALVNGFVQGLGTQVGKTFRWERWMVDGYSLLLDGQKYCSPTGKECLVDFIYDLMLQDWTISHQLLRIGHRASLREFLSVFPRRIPRRWVRRSGERP